MAVVKLVLLLFVVAASAALPATRNRTVSYEGQQVFKCLLANQEEADVLADLVEKFTIDVWRLGTETHVRVTPEQRAALLSIGLACEVLIDDVEALVSAEEREHSATAADADFFTAYHTAQELINFYYDLSVQYPALVRFVSSIGRTSEGRDIAAVHITSSKGTTTKPKFFYECLIHAREWISGATCAYLVNHLVKTYGSNATVTRLLDESEFVVIPVLNVDGYNYTWTGDRLWRKNRAVNSGSTCRGVDLNRNFASAWGQGGSSKNQCDDTYMGTAAASEPEVKAAVAYFSANAPVIGAIDWHAYSQLILRPYGNTKTNCPDEVFLANLGASMSKSALQINGKTYTSQKSIDLYVTTGTASDYYYLATANNGGYRAASYTIELRDTGTYGFQLPAAQIIPSCEEMLAAHLYYAIQVLNNPIKI